MTEYSVEEVRAIAAAERGSTDRYVKIRIGMLTAYADLLERIKAGEGAHGRIDFNGMWNAMSDRSDAPLPAQAAQVDADAELVEAMKLPDGYEVVEHLPGIWGYEYDRDDGERMASSASWNHPALAAIGAWRDHVEALAESAGPVAQHPDDAAVDAFAMAMKAKLAEARAKGRGGWQDKADCPQQRLSDMLRAHVAKGDPRDVANFCMFLHQRGESILPAEPVAQGEASLGRCKACGRTTRAVCDGLDGNGLGCTNAPPIDIAAAQEGEE